MKRIIEVIEIIFWMIVAVLTFCTLGVIIKIIEWTSGPVQMEDPETKETEEFLHFLNKDGNESYRKM